MNIMCFELKERSKKTAQNYLAWESRENFPIKVKNTEVFGILIPMVILIMFMVNLKIFYKTYFSKFTDCEMKWKFLHKFNILATPFPCKSQLCKKLVFFFLWFFLSKRKHHGNCFNSRIFFPLDLFFFNLYLFQSYLCFVIKRNFQFIFPCSFSISWRTFLMHE